MTEKLYDKNPHIKEFSAVVQECRSENGEYHIVLDKTAFFAEGGGQASDIGFIGENEIYDVQIIDGDIVHKSKTPVEVGKEYQCRIDWKKRFRNMQNHSGEHIISGLIHKHYGLDNVGFHLGEDEVTMDINGVLNAEQLREIEILANEAIIKNAKFSVLYPTDEELKNIEYRSKLDSYDEIRIVTVEGYDACACCAPHVASAGEIGIIKILDFFRMRSGIRIFIKCGFDALSDYHERYLSTKKISDLLSSKQSEVSEATQKLLCTNDKLKYINSELKRRLITEKISGFKAEKDITATFDEGLDVKELQLFADGLFKTYGGIRAVFSANEIGGYNFAICSDAETLDNFFKDFKEKLNVRGGGRNGMVQGSVLAEKHEIEALFD